MEDDDEFGDLYTDVLKPFSSSSAAQLPNPTTSHPFSPPHQPSPSLNPSPAAVDVNNNVSSSTTPLQSDQGAADDNILRGGSDGGPSNPDSNHKLNSVSFPEEDRALNSDPGASPSGATPPVIARDPPLFQGIPEPVEVSSKSNPPVEPSSRSRVLEDGDDLNLGIVGTATEGEGGAENFGMETSAGEAGDGLGADLDLEPVIPGLEFDTGPSSSRGKEINHDFAGREDGDDDWDSDSEDDLQILLNDNHHHPMDRNRMEGSDDDEDEDGDPLIIVANDDAIHPPNEEQGWGEDAGQAADGEKKESAEGAKVSGGATMATKIGYGNYGGYHPFHSQFKYVRPGATPIPSGAPGGAPGQVRPPATIGGGGRGRGDWRPGMKMQKGFQQGFWGSGGSGRGLGGDFTLPSHKTIFEVDIDSFEEKPWKYPGVDVSVFFNFGLNEESWKDYCKQLEQLRMESTPQSKVHVLGGSRTEQEYDPDLPPELAAAAGIHDHSAENMNAVKADAGPSDVAKGTARSRPPVPVGRPIPVETGSGERLPSVDTRPPRIRDSDAIIEIVLQRSPENGSTAEDGAEDVSDNDISRDLRAVAVEESSEQAGNEDSDGYPRDYVVKKAGETVMKSPNSVHDEEARESSLPAEGDEYHSESEKADSCNEDRQMKIAQDRAASMSPGESSPKGRSHDNEEPGEEVELKESPRGLSLEERVASDDEESFLPERSYGKGKEGSQLTRVVSSDIAKDKGKLHYMKKQKFNSQVDHETSKESDDGIDLKGKRSSENSKATESSDHQKWLDGADEEVIQGRQSKRGRERNRQRGEDVHSLRRREHEGSLESEKNYVFKVTKGREDSYPRRDRDPHLVHNSHGKPEGFDRRKERDYYMDGVSQRREEDPHGRRFKAENPPRNHERPDEFVFRHRGQVREKERVDKDEHPQPRKLLENGSRRAYLEKDAVSRHREKEDNLKVVRHERIDDPYSKRRKDDDVARRDRLDKEESLHSLPRDNTSRRKREREETSDHHLTRHKDESLPPREKGERHRERDDWHRSKQLHDENFSRREREDGRISNRLGRNVEEKGRLAHSRVKDEYKDAGRRNDLLKRKDRGDENSSLLNRASDDAYKNQVGNDEKKLRQERSNNKNDRAVDVSELKPKDNFRKARDSEGGHRVNSGSSRKLNEERSFKCEMADAAACTSEQGVPGTEMSMELHNNRRATENASSDDEQQRSSKRGRSKLERWTSNNDRDFGINTKSLKAKEGDQGNSLRPGYITKQTAQKVDQSGKKSDAVGTSDGGAHSVTDGNGTGLPEGKTNNKDAEASLKTAAIEDTVAKLKKRSERFKLPLPSDKDTATIKKMESEALPSSGQGEPRAAAAAEVKHERPARKRRWVSN